MLSKGFKIVSPKTFELDIESLELKDNHTIVRIEHAAICKADLRYYLGERSERILGLKYPMRLIHEATGVVLKDFSGKFKSGDSVVLVPNICDCDSCDFEYVQDCSLGENYCPKARFASSNYDGFSCECISYPSSNLIKYDKSIVKSEVAVFSELMSVCMAALRRVDILDNKTIGIWGDGILGYIMTNVLRGISKNVKIIAIGRHLEKLNKFHADEVYIESEIGKASLNLDLAIECIGGNNAANGINQMIEHVKFGRDIILTGVSENGALINTRRILEKAVRITGSTRSSISDFEKSVRLLEDKEVRESLQKLILSENVVSDITSYYGVFEKESTNRELGKNIIKFNL